MTDLVKRLRLFESDPRFGDGLLVRSAADEIERLREENAKLMELKPNAEMFSLRDQLAAVTRERDALVNALDQEMVVCHLGVFNQGDDPVKAIKELMLWSQGVGEHFAKDEFQKDAERYRWLREQHWSDDWLCVTYTHSVTLGCDCPSRERLDYAIDQAMKEQRT